MTYGQAIKVKTSDKSRLEYQMTYEEAREYLLQNYFDGDDNTKAVTECDCETEAMKIVIECIEKQIPKKPTQKDSSIYYYCPNSECGVIYTGADYCRNCGQRLERIG